MILEKDVPEIKRKHKPYKYSMKKLADEYGVSVKVIFNIIHDNGWRKCPEERFWSKVDIRGKDECWNWTAALSSLGYGHIGWEGRVVEAHRIAYLLHYNKSIDGKCILHSCDNPKCCNPHHLHKGTQRENMKEMADRGRAFNHKSRKLTRNEIRNLMKDYKSGKYTLREIGKKFGVCHSIIHRIKNGHYRDWLEDG